MMMTTGRSIGMVKLGLLVSGVLARRRLNEAIFFAPGVERDVLRGG